MPISTNEVARLTLRATFANQEIENVFYYQNLDVITVFSAQQLADTFQTAVLPAIRACQVTNVGYTAITVENLDGDRSFYEKLLDPNTVFGGLSGANVAATFLAMSIKLTTGTRNVRPGHKRLAGVNEEMMLGVGLLSSAQLALLATAGAAMIATLSPVTLGVAKPVIVGFPHPAGAHSAARVNRVQEVITGYSVASYVTSQNSRKIGRGS